MRVVPIVARVHQYNDRDGSLCLTERLLFRESRRILEEVLIYEGGPNGWCAGRSCKSVMGTVDTVGVRR